MTNRKAAAARKRFNARFEFPDQIDANECDDDRPDHALLNRYSYKAIIYPKPEGNSRTLTLDDFLDDESNPA